MTKSKRHERHLRAHMPRYDAMLKFSSLAKANNILDVGVEPYLFAELLAKNSPSDTSLYGIAYGKQANRWEKEIAERTIHIRTCNIEEDMWPFRDNHVDRIIMGAIIEHLFDPLSALREAHRVLSPSGYLVISTPNAVRLSVRIKTLLGMNPYDGFPTESKYNRHNHEWTRKELKDILEVSGFKIKNEKHVKIDRDGIKRAVNIGKKIHRSLADQMVFQCVPTKPAERQPMTYRAGLTEDTGRPE